MTTRREFLRYTALGIGAFAIVRSPLALARSTAALIESVSAARDRLAPFGWREVLLDVTGGEFDLAADDLTAELVKPLTRIDRDHAGFGDFALSGTRAIEPGSPHRSLLYHALASPTVVADRQNRRERLAIKVSERFLLAQAEEIIFASLVDDAIRVVTGQHAGTSNYRTLDELQARLDPDVFWRVHRSHLVNINMIKEIVPWFSRNYILRMKDEKSTEIPVSRTQTRRLREYLKL